ncbi:MAG: cation-translocating P-type ATPase [Betaproteobacteria bacterium]|nr:cation-translocating P-type ATPase [Betaproteobacteria bacterium]
MTSGADDSDFPAVAGLTATEAAARLEAEGYNELPLSRRRGVLAIALDVVREPIFALLVGASLIYFMLGDLKGALVLLASVLVMIAITIYQERKTERALEALRDLSSPRALVVRDRRKHRIAGREVVRGDILILEEGDRVPADAVLLDCHDLRADESLLTGESVPVGKSAGKESDRIGRPGGDNLPFVYSGTMLVQGQGMAKVVATGMATEMGRIGKRLQSIEGEPTPMQREIRSVTRYLTVFGITLAILVAVAYGLLRTSWLDGMLAGITLAIAIIPEEFVVVVVVFLALGAWRISRSRVLTRRVPVIEALGAATVLCVDKTGTLTLNRMVVKKLTAGGNLHDVGAVDDELPKAFHDVLEHAVLASEINPLDPMDRALRELGDFHLDERRAQHARWELVKEYPLSPEVPAHTHVWHTGAGNEHVVAVKGAPEMVAQLCKLDASAWKRECALVEQLAADGLRVLGVARVRFAGDEWPQQPSEFELEWLGLVGLADPVRPTVEAALADCYRAGIRVIMITGDYPVTAQAIARDIGLAPASVVVTGTELSDMSDEELRRRVGSVNIFARVMPEQKLRLVEALKDNGEIVAMTGDGVNDAPALKSAHIGIAMGGRGSDVAREAAALVLLDDDFDSIVKTVRLGRRIYRNVCNALSYLLAVHVPIWGMAVVALAFAWPMAFFPVHIVFFEFVIDPTCSIAFEAESADEEVMARSPRRSDELIFNSRRVIVAMTQGVMMLLVAALVYGFALERGSGESTARAMVFATIVLGNVGLILGNRSGTRSILAMLRSPNPALWWVISGALGGMAAALYLPQMRELFRFAPLTGKDLLLCVGAAVAGLLWFEFYKFLQVRRVPV